MSCRVALLCDQVRQVTRAVESPDIAIVVKATRYAVLELEISNVALATASVPDPKWRSHA